MTPHQVLWDGRCLPQPWRVRVGTLISNLTLRVISEDGTDFVLDPSLFRAKNTGVRVSWMADDRNAASKNKRSLSALPNIQVLEYFDNKQHFEPIFSSLIMSRCPLSWILPSWSTK